MSNEITKISKDMDQMSADQADLKKKHKSLAKFVKKIFYKLGCSSSEDSDWPYFHFVVLMPSFAGCLL